MSIGKNVFAPTCYLCASALVAMLIFTDFRVQFENGCCGCSSVVAMECRATAGKKDRYHKKVNH